MCKGKIHRATLTGANVDYEGSITIDNDLMDAAGILEYEKVQVADIANGARFDTYVIKGPRGSGEICVNGAAARLVNVGDKVIIISYAHFDEKELKNFEPRMVLVNEKNRIVEIKTAVAPYHIIR